MKLNDLKKIFPDASFFNANKNIDISGISYDSRLVKQGYLFAALTGAKLDGHSFIPTAVQNGACAILAEKKISPLPDMPYIVVNDTRRALALVAAEFFGYPSDKLALTGITGTNGKTTITYLLKSIVEQNNGTCGVIGTIKYIVGNRELPANTTTPESYDLQKLLADTVSLGAKYAFMEVSSHSLVQHRVEHCTFKTAVFTNLTRDHLDYHKTMEGYRDAKSILFNGLSKDAFAVLNADDAASKYFAERTKARTFFYSIKDSYAQFRARIIAMDAGGTQMEIFTPAGEFEARVKLLGMHNVYNILAATAAAFSLNFSNTQIQKGIEALESVRGRLEPVVCGQDFTVLVDYAHTDDALKNVLECLKNLSKSRIITVFGCGGDRDRGKRPLMGKIAETMSDVCIVTSDNPRSEDPKSITDEIIAGITDRSKCAVLVDRYDAIKKAIELARKDDIILIAGKGHENYQIYKDTVKPFDDKAVAIEFLGKRRKK